MDNLYRDFILEHYRQPHNRGVLDPHDFHFVDSNPTCGDELSMTLRLDPAANRISDVAFDGRGCAISQASASMMTEAIKGLSLEEALRLADLFSAMMQGEEVDTEQFPLEDIEALQGVAKFPARIKCATLAWKALEKGVKQPH